MFLPLFLLALAAALASIAQELRGAAWILLWPALAAAIEALAYILEEPRLTGKRIDGTIAPIAAILLRPLHFFFLFKWRIERLGSEPAFHEVAPGLLLGRRCIADEIPSNVATIVDLTSEFEEAFSVMEGRDYLVLPTLDARAPALGDFTDLVDLLAKNPAPMLVHCASGHGRSATVAAAILIAR